MSEKKVQTGDLNEVLNSLQKLAKSQTTATTKVESMRDAGMGAGSSAGATQIYHTPSNSDPGSWAGTTQRAVPEDGATDSIDENGTDYKGQAKMMKSILRKLSKGLPLTANEAQLYSKLSKAMDEDEDDDKDEAKKAVSPTDIVGPSDVARKSGPHPEPVRASMSKAKDDEDEMDKSLLDLGRDNDDVNKGFEVTDFLEGWADVQSQALSKAVSHIVSNMKKSLSETSQRQDQFNAELVKSVVGLAEAIALQAQRIEQVESTPARGPKSQLTAIEKSFNGSSEGEPLTKSMILDTLTKMVMDQKVSASEVVKFETTNSLSQEMDRMVRAYRSNGR